MNAPTLLRELEGLTHHGRIERMVDYRLEQMRGPVEDPLALACCCADHETNLAERCFASRASRYRTPRL